jgi:hypothetical protein
MWVHGAHQQQVLDHVSIMLEATQRKFARSKDGRHAQAVLRGVHMLDVVHVMTVDTLWTLEAAILQETSDDVVCSRLW